MSSEAVAPPRPEKAVPQRAFRLPREIGILGALGLMLLILAVFVPQFRDIQNLTNITRNFSFVGIVAMGMTLVILTGGIDLSVGSVWGMTAVIVAFLLTHGWPVVPAILVSLLAACGIGLMNGLCITCLKMSPFVPTLATLSIARSLALIITHGRPISIFGDEYQSFLWIGGGDVFGIPNPFIIFCVIAVFFWVLLSRTVWGRYVYAVGGNERTARLTGLRVDRLKIIVYILSAVVAGIAGLVQYTVSRCCTFLIVFQRFFCFAIQSRCCAMAGMFAPFQPKLRRKPKRSDSWSDATSSLSIGIPWNRKAMWFFA